MMKKINYLMLIALVFLLYSCRSEVLENNEEQAAHPHTTQKTTATIKDFPEFKKFIIENQGKLHLPQSVASKNGSENNDEVKVLQIKTLKRTSYNMLYDVEESGFSILAHTIDQQNNESSFIAKYVSKFTDKNLRIEDFTGTIYYEDINGKSLGSVEMINGSPVQTYSSHPGTTSKVDCSYVPIVIAVRCNLAEHHLPGEAGCLATGDDMPYYTIDFQLKCSQGQYGASGLAGGDIAAGGGGPGLLLGSARIEFFLLNIPDAPYLTDEQRNFLDANNTMIPIANRLGMYLKNNQNVQAANFVLWAVDFFKDNPNTTWSQFENWFMSAFEGKDGEDYNAAYWDNPNLAFPKQDLPTWLAYNNAYPHHINGSGMSADEVFDLVGGEMKSNHYSTNPNIKKQWQNACAIRVSRALLYSGINIPEVPGTFKGSDGKNYFVNAKTLNKFMRETFGTNPSTSTTPFNGNHLNFTTWQSLQLYYFNNPTIYSKHGIYSLVSSDPNWASGHADAIKFDATCVNSCHFEAPIEYIDIWILN